ncbi:MAG: Gfo/Idh/MocA family protein [Planctomycetota bacterium]
MKQPVSVLLVAVGGYGGSYLSALLDRFGADKARIVGAVDPQPERCSRLDDLRALDVPICETMEEFYDERSAELAVISSPIQWHRHQTCVALDNGSHVLCEKPLGAVIQDAQRMVEARDAAGRFVAIGYQWSFSEAIQRLKRDVRAGLLGQPVRMKTLVLWPRTHGYYARNGWAGARRDAEGRWVLDSPVNNATAHYLHNMFFCLGEEWNSSARPADVQGELYRANRITNYDTGALRCFTEEGVEILYIATHAGHGRHGPVFEYEFERGIVRCEGGGEPIVARLDDGSEREYGEPYNGPDRKLEQCLEAVRTGAEPACTVEAAAAQTLCMNGLQESPPRITEFPEELVRVTGDGDERRTWVEGLDEALTRCYEEWSLPTEAGLEWAVPGRLVGLDDYRQFPRKP